MRILVVGPSPFKSRGGMATVIREIQEDTEMKEEFDLDIYDSYVDGNKVFVLMYSIFSFIRFILSKRNYDLYHIHAASRGSTFRKGFYVSVVKRWGKKVILHIHGAEYMEFSNELSKHKKQRVVSILKKADMVIALSQEWKSKLVETFGLNNCVVLENGINMEKLRSAITKPANYQHAFLTLGRLGQRKGTYDLVAAVEIAKKTVPDIKCYIAGDGEIEKVCKIIQDKDLSSNIEVVGWVDFEKKLELLGKVSTVVLPSYNEGLPMSILEGMACGKAIVSTTVGAIPEVVKEKNGILVKAGDQVALAHALIKMSTDRNYLSVLRLNNIEKISAEFGMDSMHRKLGEYYKIVMNVTP